MTLHLLALETSSNICDVAVLSLIDGTMRVHSASSDETGRHAECLLPMVDQVLGQAGISRDKLSVIAFGQGPGGFTGLRVASGVTQGLAFGLELPVIPVSSLLAAAVRSSQADGDAPQRPSAYYLVAQDARMGEVYFAVYRAPEQDDANTLGDAGPGWRTVQEPFLMDATHVQAWFERWVDEAGLPPGQAVYIVGDGLDTYPFLAELNHADVQVRAGIACRANADTIAHIALWAWQQGDVKSPEHAIPLYVRDKVAYTTAERERGAGGNPRAPAYDIVFQAMTHDHLDQVAAIEARVQAFPWTRRNFADGLAAGYPGWVATRDGKVVGFYMAMMAPDVAHLLVIAVDPDHQGKGVGKLLLEHCQEQATGRGLDTIVLEVRFSNLAAIGFYQHQGFEAFTVRKDYYPAPHGSREDASVMKKVWSLGTVAT